MATPPRAAKAHQNIASFVIGFSSVRSSAISVAPSVEL
jgi:hypothetical protein